MIVVIVEIQSSAESIAALTEAILEMQKATRAEAGCRDYTFCVALEDPGKLRVNECWEDETALKRHLGAPHMAAFSEAMAAARPLDTRIACYEAQEIPFPMRR
jgi:quinol monooxygenase YgiN